MVKSTWLDSHDNSPLVSKQADYAEEDAREVLSSDFIIVDTLEPSTTGGRDVEFGVALGAHIPIGIVGPRRNIFHQLLTDENVFPDWDGMIKMIKGQMPKEDK